MSSMPPREPSSRRHSRSVNQYRRHHRRQRPRGHLLRSCQPRPLGNPATHKLYKVELSSRLDKLTDEMGFRTIEVQGSKILLNGKPIVLHGVNIHAEAPYCSGRVNHRRRREDTLRLDPGAWLQLRPPRPLPPRRAYDPRGRPPRHPRLERGPRLLGHPLRRSRRPRQAEQQAQRKHPPRPQ